MLQWTRLESATKSGRLAAERNFRGAWTVRYGNVRTSDSGELHETLHGETPSIRLDRKGRKMAQEVCIESTKNNNNNQTSRMQRPHNKAVGLIRLSLL